MNIEAFVRELFELSGWPDGGDLDGYTLQQLAIKHGLLIPEQRETPCREDCHCAEYYDSSEFPVTCYRKAPFLCCAVPNAGPGK